MHLPVLPKETCSFLKPDYLLAADLCIGLGGHSNLFLQQNPNLVLYGVDQDEEALVECRKRFKDQKRIHFFYSNFYSQVLLWKKQKILFDFIFADLGVSSMQLDTASRGFSFAKEGRLDMRMDKRNSKTAFTLINTYSAKELEKIFFNYGEETYSKFFAKKIVERREKKPFENTLELGNFIKGLSHHKTKIHPATKIFQAIRIEINQELDYLDKMLKEIFSILKSKGKLIIISFHSLEDRIVKKFFQEMHKPASPTPYPLPKIYPPPKGKILTKKPIIPTKQEIKENPRSRSAKLRVIEKI